MFAAWFFVACRYLEYVESLLKNSKIVVGNRDNLSGVGLLGKVLRVGGISAMLSVSQFCVRKGLADAGDLRAVPDRIKRLLIILWLVHLFLFASLASFCLWVGVLRG
jgi:hypothetical protein